MLRIADNYSSLRASDLFLKAALSHDAEFSPIHPHVAAWSNLVTAMGGECHPDYRSSLMAPGAFAGKIKDEKAFVESMIQMPVENAAARWLRGTPDDNSSERRFMISSPLYHLQYLLQMGFEADPSCLDHIGPALLKHTSFQQKISLPEDRKILTDKSVLKVVASLFEPLYSAPSVGQLQILRLPKNGFPNSEISLTRFKDFPQFTGTSRGTCYSVGEGAHTPTPKTIYNFSDFEPLVSDLYGKLDPALEKTLPNGRYATCKEMIDLFVIHRDNLRK